MTLIERTTTTDQRCSTGIPPGLPNKLRILYAHVTAPSVVEPTQTTLVDMQSDFDMDYPGYLPTDILINRYLLIRPHLSKYGGYVLRVIEHAFDFEEDYGPLKRSKVLGHRPLKVILLEETRTNSPLERLGHPLKMMKKVMRNKVETLVLKRVWTRPRVNLQSG